jgi:uncharacterized membrane protein
VIEFLTATSTKALSYYRQAWVLLREHFGTLIVIVCIGALVGAPGEMIANYSDANSSYVAGAFAITYRLLVTGPMVFGLAFVYVKVARGETPRINDAFMFLGDYRNVVLANFLMAASIIVGYILLIIPGIILTYRLAFVPPLVTDQNLQAVDALKVSWRMTKRPVGERRQLRFTVFLMVLTALPIIALGALALGVGVIVSFTWIGLAYALLHHELYEAKLDLSESPSD